MTPIQGGHRERTLPMSIVQIGRRRTLHAPRIVEEDDFIFDPKTVRIKAEVSTDEQRCTLTIDRPVFENLGWYFPTPQSAEGSPLAEALHAIEHVQTVLIDHDTVTLTRFQFCRDEWLTTAGAAGVVIRECVLSGASPISESIHSQIPDEIEVRTAVTKVIDEVLNPGGAGHGGVITLLDVHGNRIWLNMGGGCQGCSAAAVTLRHGIEGELRKAVPFLGGVHDATDHTALGTNPYMS